MYSQRPKSEQFGFRTEMFCSVVTLFGFRKLTEIRTNLFGFQTLVCVRNPNKHMFERSDFGQTAKLDRFIYKNIIFMTPFIYKTT